LDPTSQGELVTYCRDRDSIPAAPGANNGIIVTKLRNIGPWTAALCLLLAAGFASATVQDYDYPITNRYVATVLGTPAELAAELPASIPLRKRRIEIFPEREPPEVLWYGKQHIYSEALQKDRAPLIFLIAGTGAAHNGTKNRNMARAFYQAGFHVVAISSPTYPNFVISASATGVPGHAQHDAEDIYRVMEAIWGRLKDKIEVSSFNMAGYSLGGFNAAFVARLDEDRQAFNFRRVLMINSPVSLYNSISLLDRMSENIPGGVDNFDKFFNQLVESFTEVYKQYDDDLGDDFLYRAYQALDPKNEELAALIGVSFRLSSGSMVFVADVMADYGYAKPKGLELGRYSDLGPYREVLYRTGFTDYYHEFFYPFYTEEKPDTPRDEFIDSISLESIADYLAGSDKIRVMHNADDIILEPGEIDFFPRVFGERATIYPHGGHCGNINYRDNVAHMVSVLTEGGAL
jgi:predicted alpha/beta-hydrolase family hydrolase